VKIYEGMRKEERGWFWITGKISTHGISLSPAS